MMAMMMAASAKNENADKEKSGKDHPAIGALRSASI